MPRTTFALLASVLCAALAGCEQAPVPSPAPAATVAPTADAAAAFDPLETIDARRLLMSEAERQIKPIDLYTIGTPAEPVALRAAAVTIESLLPALPHLFPPNTNPFDANTPPTNALPAVWENFTAFQAMAANATQAAAALAAADGEEPLKEAARNLRAACDVCHQAFMQPYVPPQATDEDRNVDFDEFLPK